MKRIPTITTILIVFLVLPFCTAAQVEIPRSVMASGGANLGGVSFIISGSTLGQASIGLMTGPTDIEEIGFWYAGSVLTGTQGSLILVPGSYWLSQNYPNPFNPQTTFRFSVPRSIHVTIRVFDVLGRTVKTIVDQELTPGCHTAVLDAGGLSSGVYFCRMEAEGFVKTRKLVLLK